MTLGSRSLISHHGWMLSQITYIGPTAELARKRLMWGTWESLLSKATWKARHMLAFQGCCCCCLPTPMTQHQEVCFVFPCNTQEGPADSLICHNQRSMWGPTDGDQAGVLHLRGETTSAIFAQVPDRCPNGSILRAVIERPFANLDGPLHQERCPGAGWLVSETGCNRPLWQEKPGAL